MPTLVGAVGGPTKVGTYQGDAAVVAGGSAGRWPATGFGRCRPRSALWVRANQGWHLPRRCGGCCRGSAGRWPATGFGRCRPWSALWVSGQPRLAPTKAMRRLLQGVVPAAGRQPVLVDADLGRRCGFVPTKVGTYQGDAAVVAGGSAGRWPVTGFGRCRPWSALWISCQPRLAPTRAMHRLLQGVVPAAGRQPVLVDADLGRRCGFRANQGWHLPGRCGGCCRG